MYDKTASLKENNLLSHQVQDSVRIGYTDYDPEIVEYPEGYLESLTGVEKYLRMKKRLSCQSTEKLLINLCKIYDDDYSNKRRLVHLLIHEELTKRGLSPFWRKPRILKFNLAYGYTEAEKRYMNDLQIADLYWVRTNCPEHRTDSSYGYGRFKNVFNSDRLSYEQLDEIASFGWSPTRKVGEEALRLDETIQEELAVLRTDSVKTKMRRVIEKSVKLEMLLNEAARRNPRRGKKTLQVISKWIKYWLAHKLSDGSTTRALRNYSIITGEEVNKSTLRNRLKNMKSALLEVTTDTRGFF